MKLAKIVTGLSMVALLLTGCVASVLVTTQSGNVSEKELTDALLLKYGNEELTQLTLDKLLEKETQVDAKQVAEEVTKIQTEHGDGYENYLSKQRLTEESLANQIRRTFQLKQLAEKEIKVTDEELELFHRKWQPAVTIQHILVADEATAKKVKAELDEGADFTKLVQKYSQDVATKENDGKWEKFVKGSAIRNFEKEVFTLKEKNQVKGPFSTIMGWHFIKLLEPAVKKSFEEEKAVIKKRYIESQITNENIQKALEKLIEKNDVKVNDKRFKVNLDQYLIKRTTN